MRAKHAPLMDGIKTCKSCREELHVTSFGVCRNNVGGRQGACRRCEMNRLSISKHGLTRDEKTAIARSQGGCLVCQRRVPGEKGWVVDHDRSCCPGERSCGSCRRGVLCQWCNSALGYAMDSAALLRKLANYLDAHTTAGCQTQMPDASDRRMQDA